jgi:hypothetical protein
MASFLQLTRKSDAEPAAEPLWHPNFRNYDRLPDTKVVRTALLINLVTGTAAAVLLGSVLWREYGILTMNQQAAEAQVTIDRDNAKNTEALRLTKLFSDSDKKIAEAVAFKTQLLRPSDFTLMLGNLLPKEISLNFIDMRLGDPNTPACTLRGFVAGSRTDAGGTATSFVEMWRAQKDFVQIFDAIDLTNVAPDPRTGLLTFEIIMKMKPAKKKPSKDADPNVKED